MLPSRPAPRPRTDGASAWSQVAETPLANPWFARDVSGLPPHAISVNELDPLRDEGLAYYRKLAAAGNACYARVVAGTPHAMDMIALQAAPQVSASTLRDIIGFANEL